MILFAVLDFVTRAVTLWLCRVSDDNEENQDTVEQILKCIIENEGEREAREQSAYFPSFIQRTTVKDFQRLVIIH